MTKEQDFLNQVKHNVDKIAANITADTHANFIQLYGHRTDLTSEDVRQIAFDQVNSMLAQTLYLNLSK